MDGSKKTGEPSWKWRLNSEGFFGGQSFVQSVGRLTSPDVESLARFGDSEALAADFANAVAAPVALLHDLCGPYAIIFAVGAVVVLAMDSEPFRTGTHVSIEGLETVQPLSANGNAASAIVFECPPMGGEAPTLHFCPDHELGGARHAMLGDGCFLSGACRLEPTAPATFRLPVPDIPRANSALRAAITSTEPFRAGAIQHRPFAKPSVFHSETIAWNAPAIQAEGWLSEIES